MIYILDLLERIKEILPSSFYIDQRTNYKSIISLIYKNNKLLKTLMRQEHPVTESQMSELRKSSTKLKEFQSELSRLADELYKYAKSLNLGGPAS
jgi:hypothetical protein